MFMHVLYATYLQLVSSEHPEVVEIEKMCIRFKHLELIVRSQEVFAPRIHLARVHCARALLSPETKLVKMHYVKSK